VYTWRDWRLYDALPWSSIIDAPRFVYDALMLCEDIAADAEKRRMAEVERGQQDNRVHHLGKGRR
jgi:hypothetical protein